MRPIIIQSPLLKLTESLLLPDLKNYLSKSLHPSQPGFVPGLSIFMNIHQALNQILLRTHNGNKCYGLFVDYKSAYNTLNHQTLFTRLSPIIGKKN